MYFYEKYIGLLINLWYMLEVYFIYDNLNIIQKYLKKKANKCNAYDQQAHAVDINKDKKYSNKQK